MATPPVFSVGQYNTAAYMNSIGLWKIAATTFSASTGVEMQQCFSSDYQNYVVLTTWYGSTASNAQFQYMTGTNTKDINATYNRTGWYWITAINGFNQANTTSDFVGNHTTDSANWSTCITHIFNPAVSGRRTQSMGNNFDPGGVNVVCNFSKATTTAYTGLYLFPSAGTITGTIAVYGFRP